MNFSGQSISFTAQHILIQMNAVCVFCGSAVGQNEQYAISARTLGKVLAIRKITLIYGGGNVGLMRVIADSALQYQGEVIGIIPRNIRDKEIAHHGLTRLHIVENLQERKALMAQLADAFIVLPGGYGTLDEMFEILSWNQLEIIRKPIGLLNINGYYDSLLKFLQHAVGEKFLRPEHFSSLIVAEDIEQLLDKLQRHKPLTAENWIERLKMDLI